MLVFEEKAKHTTASIAKHLPLLLFVSLFCRSAIVATAKAEQQFHSFHPRVAFSAYTALSIVLPTFELSLPVYSAALVHSISAALNILIALSATAQPPQVALRARWVKVASQP